MSMTVTCSFACRDALYPTRQARAAPGRNMERVQRIWIISDATTPTAGLLAANPDLLLLRTTDRRLLQKLNSESPSASPVIFLVDCKGFLVFRYEATVTPGAFIRELGKWARFWVLASNPDDFVVRLAPDAAIQFVFCQHHKREMRCAYREQVTGCS